MRAYDEMVDFIAAGPISQNVAVFRLAEEARARVADLIRREKTDGLSSDEYSELEHDQQLEHLMRLSKARATRYLTGE